MARGCNSPSRWACLGLAGAGALVVSSCSGVLAPTGPIGDAERQILLDATAIMSAVIVPVIVLTLAIAWRYRASNAGAVRWLDWSFSGPLEFVVWSIPVLVVLFLGGMAWIGSHDLDPRKALASGQKPIEVDVVSLGWKWLFLYPDLGVASVNRLVIPAATPVHFRLTSATVMNSFFIPGLGGQIYAMAGMTTELNLLADKPGDGFGLSAQFSGDGFSDMRFPVQALPKEGFDAWVNATRGHGDTLDLAREAKLAQPSRADAPTTFGALAPGLFDAIVANSAPDGPMSQTMPKGQ